MVTERLLRDTIVSTKELCRMAGYKTKTSFIEMIFIKICSQGKIYN